MAGNNTYIIKDIPLDAATVIVQMPHGQQAVLHVLNAVQTAGDNDGFKIDWYLHPGALPAVNGTTVKKFPTALVIPTDVAPANAECCRALAQLTDTTGQIHMYSESGWHMNSMRQSGGIIDTHSWLKITVTTPAAPKRLDIMALFRNEKF